MSIATITLHMTISTCTPHVKLLPFCSDRLCMYIYVCGLVRHSLHFSSLNSVTSFVHQHPKLAIGTVFSWTVHSCVYCSLTWWKCREGAGVGRKSSGRGYVVRCSWFHRCSWGSHGCTSIEGRDYWMNAYQFKHMWHGTIVSRLHYFQML